MLRTVTLLAPVTAAGVLVRGVTSISSHLALAVGDYTSGGAAKTLVLRWNGKAWKGIRSPGPGAASIFYSACGTSSADAGAVGYYESSTGSNDLAAHV